MAQARNYDREMSALAEGFQQTGERPRLLVHVCCAPCSTSVLERLAGAFDLVVYFDNPNLDTAREHDLRALEVRRLLQQTGLALDVIVTPYQPEAFYQAVRGLELEPEGGRRCEACFRLRLNRSARAARELGCGYLTTSLSVSPRKDAHLLNTLGEEATREAGVRFLPSDFKKRGGYQRSVALSRQFGLYRQDYCGCVFSRRDARQHPAGPPGNLQSS